jgi:hypothetical protein
MRLGTAFSPGLVAPTQIMDARGHTAQSLAWLATPGAAANRSANATLVARNLLSQAMRQRLHPSAASMSFASDSGVSVGA